MINVNENDRVNYLELLKILENFSEKTINEKEFFHNFDKNDLKKVNNKG